MFLEEATWEEWVKLVVLLRLVCCLHAATFLVGNTVDVMSCVIHVQDLSFKHSVSDYLTQWERKRSVFGFCQCFVNSGCARCKECWFLSFLSSSGQFTRDTTRTINKQHAVFCVSCWICFLWKWRVVLCGMEFLWSRQREREREREDCLIRRVSFCGLQLGKIGASQVFLVYVWLFNCDCAFWRQHGDNLRCNFSVEVLQLSSYVGFCVPGSGIKYKCSTMARIVRRNLVFVCRRDGLM